MTAAGRSTVTRIAVSGIAAVILVVRSLKPLWMPSDAVSVGLLIIVALPWLSALIEEAEFPGGWKFKFWDLERKTEAIRQVAEETTRRLDRLILSSLSDRLRKELQDFSDGVHTPVRIIDAYTHELWHLHNLGYIRFRPRCAGFDDLPRDRDIDLLEYMEITPLGREYLELAKSAQDVP
jgi:hypothetical protein